MPTRAPASDNSCIVGSKRSNRVASLIVPCGVTGTFKSARKNHHEFMTVEHLLLALLDNEIACNILKSCNCDLNNLRDSLEQFINSSTPLLDDSEANLETQATLGFQRVLQRAVFHVQSSG